MHIYRHTDSYTELAFCYSVGRLCLPSPQRALAALGLMLTCMYSGKLSDGSPI